MRFSWVLLAVTILSLRSAAQKTILGVLEDSRGHYAGEPNRRTVRVIFEKNGDEWSAFQSDCEDRLCLKTVTPLYPQKVDWTIAFDGRKVGQVTGRTPTDFQWYGDVGQQQITGEGPVPTIGAQSREYGGYSDAAVYRPLIANSREYFSDPDRWKPSAVSAELMAALRRSFRKKFPQLCRLSDSDHSKLESYPYRDEDVTLVKSYRSTSGWVVARLHLEAIDCADVEAGFDIDDPWFVIDTPGSVLYLDSGMWLVDAGDYDNDGRSELIFSINRENEGGYEIYYDQFRRHATFKFNYH